MASSTSMLTTIGIGALFSYMPSSNYLKMQKSSSQRPVPSRSLVVKAEGPNNTINPEIRKSEAKVVDNVLVSELSKPVTAYCRCWRSGTFPLCDGSHVKHNKDTGDNVGPLLVKKSRE